VRIGRADDLASRLITEFGSEGASVVHVATGDHTSVVQIELSAGGRFGMHHASCSQLFIVIEADSLALRSEESH
jgi:quercetin dioxygenase-like cupin family protein